MLHYRYRYNNSLEIYDFYGTMCAWEFFIRQNGGKFNLINKEGVN